MRQNHQLEDGQSPGRADEWRDPGRWQGRDEHRRGDAEAWDRLRDPAGRPVSTPDHRGKRGDRPALARLAAAAHWGAYRGAARARRPRSESSPESLSLTALGR